jgi:aspartate dehydrogenase
MARIGIVGFGYLGSYIYEQIRTRPELGLDVAFVSNRSQARLEQVPRELILDQLEDAAERGPDLVVELAHPDISRQYGRAFLSCADYMPLSLTCLADASVERSLLQAARDSGTRLCVPHGAVLGLDALSEGRDMWDEVSITMKKPPRSIDFSDCPNYSAEDIRDETVLYDGPTRQVCALFPRNVNSHAATALAGIGFERTRSVLVADPALDVSLIELSARGQGVEIDIRRANPMQGVSGVLTLLSSLASIARASGPRDPLFIC